MQQLLDNPGLTAALVTLIGVLGSLMGALTVYVNAKTQTEQARQSERMVGLQRQMDQWPSGNGSQGAGQSPYGTPFGTQAQAPPALPQGPPVATTVLTLPVDGTALHIEAVPRATPPVPPVGPSVSGTDPATPDQAGGLP